MSIKTFEQILEALIALEGFRTYNIIQWNSYSATLEYFVNETKHTKKYIDDGTGNWIEVEL